MDREVSVPIKLKASVQQGRVITDLVAIIEVVRNPLTFGMPPLFMWTSVPVSFFTSSRKKSQYLRPCCLHGPLQLLTGRLEWSIWYTIKNIREGMLNRADLFRTCRSTPYNSTISKSPTQARQRLWQPGVLAWRPVRPHQKGYWLGLSEWKLTLIFS